MCAGRPSGPNARTRPTARSQRSSPVSARRTRNSIWCVVASPGWNPSIACRMRAWSSGWTRASHAANDAGAPRAGSTPCRRNCSGDQAIVSVAPSHSQVPMPAASWARRRRLPMGSIASRASAASRRASTRSVASRAVTRRIPSASGCGTMSRSHHVAAPPGATASRRARRAVPPAGACVRSPASGKRSFKDRLAGPAPAAAWIRLIQAGLAVRMRPSATAIAATAQGKASTTRDRRRSGGAIAAAASGNDGSVSGLFSMQGTASPMVIPRTCNNNRGIWVALSTVSRVGPPDGFRERIGRGRVTSRLHGVVCGPEVVQAKSPLPPAHRWVGPSGRALCPAMYSSVP